VAKYSGGLLGSAYNEVGNFVTRGQSKVNAQLREVVKEAANRFPGYEAHVYSGYRPGDKRNHGKGRALDVALVDKKTGKVLDNYQNAKAFRTYEKFAQTVREVQQEKYPELDKTLRWGGYFSGNPSVYGAVDLMHFDISTTPMAGGSWDDGLTQAQRDLWPGAESYGLNSPRPPDRMQAPLSLAQTQMRDEALAQAFGSPSRALDVPQSALAFNAPARPSTPSPLAAINSISPPSRFAPAPAGNVKRASLPAIPASLTPAPVGKVDRAPLGPVAPQSIQTKVATRPDVRVGTLPAAPTRSLQHPTSVAKPTNLAAAPVGKVTKGPALAPATPNASTLAAQYGQYRPSTATSMPAVATPPSVPVGALPAAKPSTATLAAQYAQYRPGTVPPAPVAPVTPPALALPPAQVLAPLLAPPKVVKDYPVAEVQQAPAPPRATAYDVYSGLADTALDNTGLNTVSSMAGGGTSVTNKYGATTGMTPGGYQTAVGSLPGISGPTASKFGGAIKGALPGMAGASLGGLLGGPVGALLGAALAKAVSQPGGLLSGQASYAAPGLPGGVVNAARPQSGGAFPSAPSAPSGQRNVRGWDSAADRARGESISPGASAAIGRNQGGLY
jgi:hypothetical protein